MVRKDIQSHLVQLERHVEKLEQQAEVIVQADPELAQQFRHLVSVRGIARVSALHLLAELVILAPDMTARQWVAHAGLDPRHHDSGTSIHKPARISRAGNRYLRAALFMPALSGHAARSPYPSLLPEVGEPRKNQNAGHRGRDA